MNTIRISDITMKQAKPDFSLSFREKIELSKLLDKLNVDVIELEQITAPKVDFLKIKSIAAAVKHSALAVPVDLSGENIDAVWNALHEAKHPRLQVCAPVSAVQMEYLYHKKPEAMMAAVENAVTRCKALCADVEFIADDATRSDGAFLRAILSTAIAAGATTVTVCDTAGNMLPQEFGAFIAALAADIPELKNVTLGVSCADSLNMADACAMAAIAAGAGELKAAAYRVNAVSLTSAATILNAKGDALNAGCGVMTTSLKRITDQIARMCSTGRSKFSPFDSGVQEDDGSIYLTAHDELGAVLRATAHLGYDLSEEDGSKVYEAFRIIAQKKEKVSAKELDAIVASAAMQVPSAYKLESYVITSGNEINATAQLKLWKQEKLLQGVSLGDGPIDAAFLAVEQITGRHYELDDFQIQSVTEGREAMGQTVVKLRSEGKVYSGTGISTDIVGASIRAYISALNKIVYEEDNA